MPRQPKPYLRKQTNSWYCSIGGRQISLGKNREAAFEKFHALMADRDEIKCESTTLYALSQVYLDWCQAHRKPGTYNLHRHYLKLFIEYIGRTRRPSKLKTGNVTAWLDGMEMTSTAKNGALAVVQRMLNWAVEQEYLNRNPIKGMKRPKSKRRDIIYTDAQWEKIKQHADEPLAQLLDFLCLTGCRPLEARTLEARHLHGDLVIFPADESKGEFESRVIYLVPDAKSIVESLAMVNPEGALFRNSRGKPWTKNAINLRLERISKKVGFRVIAYGARHTFATNALAAGIDSVSLAHLMGHRDPTMVSKVYSHLSKNPQFLRQQAQNAVRSRNAS
ncbi:tyrosine-type recombinase/integrase [Aeoliella sp.]|uniref:tyrosine-type recombinase/integrase n=1 Tax=Aeoliella sp. TaxID=2795800 RepID=UPI003CCB9ADF